MTEKEELEYFIYLAEQRIKEIDKLYRQKIEGIINQETYDLSAQEILGTFYVILCRENWDLAEQSKKYIGSVRLFFIDVLKLYIDFFKYKIKLCKSDQENH